MEQKENIVILSLEEYNRMTTDIRTLCARNERLRASVDDVEILKTELCKLKKVEEYNIDLSEMYFKQKKVISRLKKQGSFTRLLRTLLIKTFRKYKQKTWKK